MKNEAAVNNNIQENNFPITSAPPSAAPSLAPGIRGHIPNPYLHPTSTPTLLACASSAKLETKVKALTQRRPRGRWRGEQRMRVDAEESTGQPERPASSQVPQRAHSKGKAYLLAHTWRLDAVRSSSGSGSSEEEELEVQVRLDIHTPPVGLQGELENGAEGRGIGEGASVENLSDDSTEGPAPHHTPPLTVPTSSLSSLPTSSASASSSRHWAPPKGFWKVARPETLLIHGPDPHNSPSSFPVPGKACTQAAAAVTEPQRETAPAKADDRSDAGSMGPTGANPLAIRHSDSLECYLNRYKHKEEKHHDAKVTSKAGGLESLSSQGGTVSVDESIEVTQGVGGRSKVRRRQFSTEEKEGNVESKDTCRFLDTDSDSNILTQEHESCSSLLVVNTDELPLSLRHEQAKRVLERARLKAHFNHVKDEHPQRRAQSDPRSNTKRQQGGSSNPPPPQEAVVLVKEEAPSPSVSSSLVIPDDSRESSYWDQGNWSRRYGCSPTKVRFEDESEKEAKYRYLDRLRERRQPGDLKAKSEHKNARDSERCTNKKGSTVSPSQRQDGVSGEALTVMKEIIVFVKKCEACGSIVREPPSLASEPQNAKSQPPGNHDDISHQLVPRWVPPNKPEASARPKAPLTVTFAGAFVVGENKQRSKIWRTSGFGKLKRRSRKGECRLESGDGPYGHSWAQRRNSNPRTRSGVCGAVSCAPGSAVALESHTTDASESLEGSPTPSPPIKSALKSSSKSRTAQTSAQVGAALHIGGLDSEQRREDPVASMQGTSTATSSLPCIRLSTLRHCPARLSTDLQAAELWNTTSGGTGLALCGDSGSGSECHPGLRNLGLSRSEDLRAELLRAEHLKSSSLKAGTRWEDDVVRKSMAEREGRPKLSLRRFFSSIGLNSVGRLVKGNRSSSMEQLSVPTGPRVSTVSPSPRRRPPAIHIQRAPSLQTLHPVLPLAQLRKTSSVQGLERRTERSTILGEVQIPYGLAFSHESPQMELHGALTAEEIVFPSRVMRPVCMVTHAFPDGTLLLELTKPPNGPYGFVISRGKGRPDTGVYVGKVCDGGGSSPYGGLLGVGDEILQVNGEAVAGLTLDQVTCLMTRDSMASIRILPRRGTEYT